MGLTWIAIVLQLAFLEGILSIDNAAVLGAMVAPLPSDCPVPWPRSLQALGHRLDPLLGTQQHAALKVGLLGAYAGRGLMLLVAHFIIQNPWLHLIGGAYLIYLAAENLSHSSDDQDLSTTTTRHASQSFWGVVLAVELADLTFSLDNIVAAVALSSHILVVMLGVAIGILAMRFAAGVFADLIQREPILESAAYLLVLTIGLRLILENLFPIDVPTMVQFGLSIAILALTLAYAHWPPLHIIRPLLVLCQWLMRETLNLFRRLAVQPIGALLGLLVAALQEH